MQAPNFKGFRHGEEHFRINLYADISDEKYTETEWPSQELRK
jgi:hypothetical protein